MNGPAMISRRAFLHQTAALTAALGSTALRCRTAPAANDTPNVIIIFTDDQGFGDLGNFGSPLIRTPHLDKMAREGRRFTSFYSASPVCSPSRAALLTGCYPPRVGVPEVLWPDSRYGLNPDEITIADMLRECGYATTCIGKWHLGDRPEMLPTRHSFDSYFGIPYSNDMYIDPNMILAEDVLLREGMTADRIRTEKPEHNLVPLMRDEEVIEYPCDQTTITQRYTEEAVKFIKANRDRPFFIYLPHTMPHIPLFVSDKFRGTSARGLYGDVIEEIDWSVGEILRALKEYNLDARTLVIFTSDNGPWNLSEGEGGSAGPLRGYKFQTYEGGMREPCIMRWPGKIPADTLSLEVAGTIDLLPTIAGLAGASVPTDRVIDGKDIWPLMSGGPEVRSPHEAYFYYSGNLLEAVRSGKWKLRRSGAARFYELHEDLTDSRILADNHPAIYRRLDEAMNNLDGDDLRKVQEEISALDGFAEEHRDLVRRLVERLDGIDEVELYDLQLDVSESRNLADRHPDLVRILTNTMHNFDRDLRVNTRPPFRRI
jgi:arylsulfatase A